MKHLLIMLACQTLSWAAQAGDTSVIAKLRPHLPLIDRICADFARQHHIPGVSVGLVANGQLMHTVSLGVTDMARNTPVTPSSVFRIASMSKSFTAMAILKLRDAGKLQLEDPAERYIPSLKGLKYPTADAAPVTIRHLLTHGAGFPEDNPWGDRQLADSDAEFNAFLKQGITFSTAPGTAYEYSNLGFAMLGKIITTVSGQPYQQFIREQIWKPLGMSHAAWEYSEVEPGLLAHGYRYQDNRYTEEQLLHDTPDGSWGAMGSMLSSVDEFAAYMNLHLSAWPPSDATESGPVRRASIREMHHPWRFSALNPTYTFPGGRVCATAAAYCYGLRWVRDCEGRTFVGHSGGLPGFGSHWQVMPEYGLGIVALGNRTYSPMSVLTMQILDTLVRLTGLKPTAIPVSPILQTRMEQLTRIIPDWKGAEQSAIFAENFFPDYTLPLLQRQSAEIFGQIGAVRRVGPMRAENNLRGTFTLECERGRADVYFTLTPEKVPLIQEYRIRVIK
jgi:CubicO group peptidase (beta-lactamase class C family)